ncbi:hypothetical protein [Streptomyces sp. NRRL F-525]|uniref:hypothetical protein n=1 Tax=Streptomyces sp. NRRL F-525 TaxID=1463861 RepID=UPI00068A4930|nr:hypothetical protein [Streptomyces sp. NRRL F-525]
MTVQEISAMTTNDGRSTPPKGWLTRHQLAAAHGISGETLSRLWRARATNSHPEPVRYGGIMHWHGPTWASWYDELQKQQAAAAPPLPVTDDDGDPDELIGPQVFRRMLGHNDNSWVSKAAVNPPPGFPEPDTWGDPVNRKRPKWRRRRAREYALTRHTQPRSHGPRAHGRRAGSRNNPPYLYAGDPRLALARQILAEHPDERTARHIERLHELSPDPASTSTWTKILKTAREHPTES